MSFIKHSSLFIICQSLSIFASDRATVVEINPLTGKSTRVAGDVLTVLRSALAPDQIDVKCTLTQAQIDAALGMVEDAQSYINAIKGSLRASVPESITFRTQELTKSLPKELILDAIELGILSNMKLFEDNLVFLHNALVYDFTATADQTDKDYTFGKLCREIASINQWFGSDPAFASLIRSISDLDYLGTLQGIFAELASFFPSSTTNLRGSFFAVANGRTRVDEMDARNKEEYKIAKLHDDFDYKKFKRKLRERFKNKKPLIAAIFNEVKSRNTISVADQQHEMAREYVSCSSPAITALFTPLTKRGRKLYENDMKRLQLLHMREERINAIAAKKASRGVVVNHSAAAVSAEDLPASVARIAVAEELQPALQVSFGAAVNDNGSSDAILLEEYAQDDSSNEASSIDWSAFHTMHQERKRLAAAAAEASDDSQSHTNDEPYLQIIRMLNDAIYSNTSTVSWSEFARIITSNGYRIDNKNGSARNIIQLSTGKKFTVHEPHDASQPLSQLGEYRSFIASGFSRIFSLTPEYVEEIMTK